MTSIREKITTEGTIPILSREGINVLLKYLLNNYPMETWRRPKVPKSLCYPVYGQTRNLRLSDSKMPHDQPNTMEDRKRCEQYVFGLVKGVAKEWLQALEHGSKEATTKFNLSDIDNKEFTEQDLREVLNFDVSRLPLDFKDESVPSAVMRFYNSFANTQVTHVGKYFSVGSKSYKTELDDYNELHYDYKIYINTPEGPLKYKFFAMYAKKCVDRGISYDCKLGFNTGNSVDRTSLYMHEEDLDSVLEILEEIKREAPEIAQACGTPMLGAMNYSYYAVVDRCNKACATYNDWFENMSWEALFCTIAKLVQWEKARDSQFWDSLTEREKKVVEDLASMNGFEQICEEAKSLKIRYRGNADPSASEQKIFPRLLGADFYVNGTAPECKDVLYKMFDHCKQKLEDGTYDRNRLANEYISYIRTIASIKNWGDRKHLYGPLCLRESFFDNGRVDYDKSVRIDLEDHPLVIRKRKEAEWLHKQEEKQASRS